MNAKPGLVGILFYMTMIPGVIAQSNGNKRLAEFLGKSDKLLEATGWQLNKETKQWIGNKNVVDDRESPPSWASHTPQSFAWIQFATAVHKDQTYYVMLYEKRAGQYQTVNTVQEWVPELRTYFFIMSPAEFERIRKLAHAPGEQVTKVISLFTGYISDLDNALGGVHLYNEKNLLERISRTIDGQGHSEDCLLFSTKIKNGQPLVRFLLPVSCHIAENFMKTGYFEVGQPEFLKMLE